MEQRYKRKYIRLYHGDQLREVYADTIIKPWAASLKSDEGQKFGSSAFFCQSQKADYSSLFCF